MMPQINLKTDTDIAWNHGASFSIAKKRLTVPLKFTEECKCYSQDDMHKANLCVASALMKIKFLYDLKLIQAKSTSINIPSAEEAQTPHPHSKMRLPTLICGPSFEVFQQHYFLWVHQYKL
jgi:hypothetical protein